MAPSGIHNPRSAMVRGNISGGEVTSSRITYVLHARRLSVQLLPLDSTVPLHLRVMMIAL